MIKEKITRKNKHGETMEEGTTIALSMKLQIITRKFWGKLCIKIG